jgi:hypothetical protein
MVESLVEYKYCEHWLCLECADISPEVLRALQDLSHAIHVYCRSCNPTVNTVLTKSKAQTNDAVDMGTVGEGQAKSIQGIENNLTNMIKNVEDKGNQLLTRNVDIVKESEDLGRTYADMVKVNLIDAVKDIKTNPNTPKPTDEKEPLTISEE